MNLILQLVSITETLHLRNYYRCYHVFCHYYEKKPFVFVEPRMTEYQEKQWNILICNVSFCIFFLVEHSL